MVSSSSRDLDVESRLGRREVVTDLAREALATGDLDRTLETVVAEVAETLECGYCGAFERRSDSEAVVRRAGDGSRADAAGETVAAGDETLAGAVLERGEPLVVENRTADGRVPGDGAGLLADRFVSAVGVRVGPAADPWGLLVAASSDPAAFTEADGEFLESVAEVVESAVEGAAVRREPVDVELEEIYGRISDAFFALDEEFRFTYLNERAHELINPEDRTLVGETLWEAFPEAVGREFEAQYERAMYEQETVSFEEYYPEPLDTWFEVRAYPSESGLSVYFRDVTDRKRTRQQLAEERDMFAEGPAVVFRWKNEPGWPVEYVSGNVEDVLGYAPAELESGDVPYTDLLFEEELDRIAEEVEANSDDDTERFSHDPYRIRTKDGDVRWVKDTTKIIRDEGGEITDFLGYLVDITERKERERELERFEILFEESTDVNAVLDVDGTYEYLPPSAENVLGYRPEELAGDVAFEYIHPEDRERAVEAFERVLEDPDHQPTLEFRYRHADGSWIWLEATGRNLLGDPRVEGVVVYTRDVTDRKQREQELQRRKRRFEAIFEDPNILVGLLDPDGTVQDINQTAMEYIDADLEAVRGELFWETPWWGEGEDVRADVREWTERAADGEYVPFEADLTRPDGESYTLEGVFRPVTDEDGEVVSIVVSDRDVTERREYERQLEESEQRYRALAEHFPNGIVTMFDRELRYTLAAGQAFEYLPVTPEDLEARTPRQVWGEAVGEELEPLFRDALDGEKGSVEVSYVDRDWLVYAVPVTDEDGEVFAGMTMAQDVTERREYERQLEESERRYRTLAEHFPNGAVGVYDEDLRYTLAEGTKLGEDLPSAEELEGDRMPDIFPPDTVADLEPIFRAAVEDGETGNTRTRFGGRYWRVWAAPLRDNDGEIFAGLSFAQDVTEQVERERRLERFETIVETVNDGVYVVDEDGYFTMVNEAYAELLGYPQEDLVGMHVSTIVDNDVLEEVTEIQAGLESGTMEEPSMEAEVLTASGEPIPAEATFALLPEDDDRWHRVGVVRDVSDRKERERRLAESERRYRTLVENFPDGAVAMFDADMEYTVAGGQLLDAVGVDASERVGNSVYDIYPEDLVAEIEPYFEAALEGDTNAFEVEFYDRHLHAHTLPVRNAAGEIFAGMLVVQDVTERRKYERELETRARQQQAVAELGQYALEVDDLDELMAEAARRVADVLDNEYCKVLDLDPDSRELLLRQGVGWREGSVGSATVGADESDSQAGYTLRSEGPVVVEDLTIESRFHGPALLTDHDVRSGISTVIGSLDEPWGILGTHDTERRAFTDEDVNFVQSVANIIAEAIERHQYQSELEELVADLEESNERLEQFAYAASHDLQEPLRMVSSYLQLVESRYADELDESGEEFIEYAVDGAERMREMIGALLEYSRVETRGDPFEPVDLEDVLADVREDLQVRITESDAEVTAGPLPTVEGDRDQLRQVFQNLLDNAIEYSGDEPPRVHVDAERSGDRWLVSVADEGVGIPSESSETVFEVFQRLHSREDHEGTGIGLALCERIVERHGGDIWVESEPGEGSTFYFTLPGGGRDE